MDATEAIMELGEPAGVDIIASQAHDSECYFCNAKDEPAQATNELTDKVDEDSLGGSMAEVRFKNDSGSLGAAIGGDQGKRTVKIESTRPGKVLEVSVAAHHLIPGNASLAKSTLFKSKKYLWKDEDAKGNIGYNVNSAPNGVWLPGNYAARPWGTQGESFEKEFGPSPKEYAFAAIDSWRAQFHDAHEEYSTFVKDALDKIFQKLENSEELWCPEAKSKKEKSPEERSPLYVLVARLNTVSSRMRRMLVAPSTNWKKNVWTSRFSESYMNDRTTHL